jgi:hypothetical protein
VHPGVAEERKAAVHGEQAQANQASESGDHSPHNQNERPSGTVAPRGSQVRF